MSNELRWVPRPREHALLLRMIGEGCLYLDHADGPRVQCDPGRFPEYIHEELVAAATRALLITVKRVLLCGFPHFTVGNHPDEMTVSIGKRHVMVEHEWRGTRV